MSTDFDALVAGTAGTQPWRRVMHAGNGVLLAAALTWLPVTRGTALALLGAALLAQAGLDLVRLRHAGWNARFFRIFRRLASPREARGPASSTWYTLGVLLTVALFPEPAAVSGILVLAVADPAAGYVGRRWGRRRILGGSVEGTAVFLATSLLILGLRHPLPVAAAAALLATLAERLSWPLDDNLVVPVVAALTASLPLS